MTKLSTADRAALASIILATLETAKSPASETGLALLAAGKAFTVPAPDAVFAWIDTAFPEVQTAARDLLTPPFAMDEIGRMLDVTVKAVNKFKANGIPGLASGDVAAAVARWAAFKFGPPNFVNSWAGGLFAGTVLPALVKAAYLRAFPKG